MPRQSPRPGPASEPAPAPPPEDPPRPTAPPRPGPARRSGRQQRAAAPGRRSYAQYCGAARALDVVGDRWALLIVRELLAGARRYTDLHADLPGVSTDMLAARLKDLERDGIVTRRRLSPPAAAFVYQLTDRGRLLLPVLQALADWGAADLGERRPTDAVRAHWFALPLRARLTELGGTGVAEVHLDEGVFHVWAGSPADPAPPGGDLPAGSADAPPAEGVPVYGDGPAPGVPDARLRLDAATCTALATGALTVPDAVRTGRLTVTGDGPLAKTVRGDA